MKQTNNAIKFLMAQYRAIFKNANIAMVAAMAAAALAAGQAQAAAPGADGTNPLGKFENELKDSTIGSGDNLTHDASNWVVLNAPANKPIKVENGGKLSLSYTGNAAKGNLYTGNDLVVNSGGTITLKGSEDAKAEIAGLVGAAKETSGQDRATPTASLTINKDGKLDVTSSFAMMKDVNINGTVNIKGTTGKTSGGADSGEYLKYAAVYAETGNLTVGSDAAVTLGAASHLYGQNIAINGGTITFEGTTAAGKDGTANSGGALLRAGDSKNGGALTISNGKLNVAKGKSGDIVADTLNMKGGEINVSGTMGIGGNYHPDADVAEIDVTGGKVTVAKGGTLNLGGNASFADGTLANAGTVNVVIPQDGTRTLNVSSQAFTELLKGKLTANGVASSGTETLELIVDGDADLVTAGFVNAADGAINTKKVTLTEVNASSLTAKNVTIDAGTYTATNSLTADNLTAGKDGAFKVGKDLTATVKKCLTVTAKESKADLTVNNILNLDGTGGNVAANVELAQDQSSTPALNVKSGNWNMQSLKLTSGAATVSGENTKVTFAQTSTLETTTNGKLKIQDNALVDASAGIIKFGAADTVLLTGGSTLVLDGNDVFKIENGSVSLVTAAGDVKSTFTKSAVNTDSTSVLQLKYTGDLSLKNIEDIKGEIAEANKLNGFIKFEGANITNKPTQDTGINDVEDGVDGIYNDVAVTVGKGGSVSKNFTAGQIKLTDASDSKAAVVDGKTVMLTGSKGDFIIKSGGEAADASLGNGSSLVLAGNGAIGAINGSQAKSGAVSIGHSSLGTGTVTANEIGGTASVKSVDVFNSKLNVAGKVATDSLSLEGGSSLNITAAAGSGSITADTLSVDAASSISAAGQAIAVGGTTNGATKILGDVTAKSLTYAGTGTHIIAGDAVVNLDTLDFGTSTVQIGDDAAEANG